jgi:hypothetical protein
MAEAKQKNPVYYLATAKLELDGETYLEDTMVVAYTKTQAKLAIADRVITVNKATQSDLLKHGANHGVVLDVTKDSGPVQLDLDDE